ncbi:MAG: putative diguanylate cyclase [Methanocella sp. PtaU1.Bin125]|nr:MAG: putative diguanylate cyclase [Methanocella sp. PtaU1.Bin125]
MTIAPAYIVINGSRGMINQQRDRAGDRAHEERICREIVESVNCIILRWDTSLMVTFINDYGQRFFGYPRDEIVGKSLIGTIVPATGTAGGDLAAMIREIDRHPEQYTTSENESVRRDGTRVWVSWTNRAVRDRAGNVVEIVSVGNDVTRRKRAEDELERQLRITRTLLDTIPIPVFYKDANGIYTGCNRAFAAFVGKPKEEIIGRTVYGVAPRDLADVYHKADMELIRHPGTQVYEASVVSADGTPHEVVFNKATFLDEHGMVGGLIGTITDVTERNAMWRELVSARVELERRVQERTKELKEANQSLRHEILEHRRDEEALKKRAEFEKLITSLSSRFINLAPGEMESELSSALKKIGEFAGVDRCYIGLVYDHVEKLDIVYEWVAPGVRRYPQFYGQIPVDEFYPWSAGIVRRLEVLHIPDTDALPPEAGKDKETLQAQQIKSIVVVPMVYKKALIGIVGFDSVREKKPWSDDDIKLLRIVGEIFTSALERKWIEEALRESEERFRAVFDRAALGIAMADAQGYLVNSNPAYQAMLGYTGEELRQKRIYDVTWPEDVKRNMELERQLKDGKVDKYRFQKRYVRKDGRVIWANANVSAIRNPDGSLKYNLGVVEDITDRKRAEEALRESEANLALAQQIAHIGIWNWDIETGVLHWTDEVYKIFGYAPGTFTPDYESFLAAIVPEDRDRVDRAVCLSVREGSHIKMDFRILRPDGEQRYVNCEGGTIIGPGGTAVRMLGVCFDITERKQAEEALRESEERFRATFEQAAVGIAHVSLDGHYIRVNEKYCDIVGYSCDEMVLRTYQDITYQEDLKADEALVRELLEGKKATGTIEKRYIRKDGSLIWVNLTVSIARTPDGAPEYFIAVAADMTKRRQAEEALRESEEKFRTLAESSSAAITIFRDNENIFVNRAAAEITGYSIEELMTIGPIMTIAPGYRAQAMKIIEMLDRGERTRERLELEILRKDGSTRWIDISAAPISYHGKNALISIALDVTERKQAEEALKEAKARAELYLDLMGHDISNMNQAMMGYLEMAQELLDLKGHEELIERPLEIIRHSSRLIASVKKLELIQAGKYPIGTVNMCQMLKEVAGAYAVVPGREVNIRLSLAEGCQVAANDLLKDVFDNLVDNAIRHSAGPVTVDISTEPVLEDGEKYYRISVSDNGPGIPDDLKRKIFLFIDAATGSPGRRGLGLYMVKLLVESYRGRVRVEDRVPGDHRQGSRFVVLLPAAEDAKGPREESKTPL